HTHNPPIILMLTRLQLTMLEIVIVINENDLCYTFGDIISFPKKCAKINKAYKHFAVYVGTDNFLLIVTDKHIGGKYCVFGSLKDQGEHAKENYLDNKLTPSSRDDIIKHIELMKAEENCGKYNLLNNNCEHLATYVRYGQAYLNQVCDNNIVLLQLKEKTNKQKKLTKKLMMLFGLNHGEIILVMKPQGQ
uniref:LRAT domain-containing protein n=1 Tax=Neolamprologus brichardi TaxID=32507 RepID=A0A3Q4MP37_NEOBR